jgi:hypothetical protein
MDITVTHSLSDAQLEALDARAAQLKLDRPGTIARMVQFRLDGLSVPIQKARDEVLLAKLKLAPKETLDAVSAIELPAQESGPVRVK